VYELGRVLVAKIFTTDSPGDTSVTGDVNMWKNIRNYLLVFVISLAVTAICVSPLLVAIAARSEIKAWEQARAREADQFVAKVTSVCSDRYYLSGYKVDDGQLEVSCSPRKETK
jgi:hypothetical protein